MPAPFSKAKGKFKKVGQAKHSGRSPTPPWRASSKDASGKLSAMAAATEPKSPTPPGTPPSANLVAEYMNE